MKGEFCTKIDLTIYTLEQISSKVNVFLKFRYYIGNRITELNRKIQTIQLPKQIRRNFRPLSERDYYHAHEWKFILLFVAHPLLAGILSER